MGVCIYIYIYTYISERTALRVGPEPTYYRSLNNCLYYFLGDSLFDLIIVQWAAKPYF